MGNMLSWTSTFSSRGGSIGIFRGGGSGQEFFEGGGGGQDPRKGKSVGIFKLIIKKTLGG